MSRTRRRCDEIAGIRALRVLSTRLAEHKALAQRHTLNVAIEEREDAQSAMGEAIADWDRVLAVPGFDPQAVALWSASINRQSERIAQCDAAVEEQREELVRAQGGYHLASAEERCADVLWRKAHARLSRQREEQALAARDDETTRAGLRR